MISIPAKKSILADPNLGKDSDVIIASRHGVSTPYVRKLREQNGVASSRNYLRQRVAEALQDPQLATHSDQLIARKYNLTTRQVRYFRRQNNMKKTPSVARIKSPQSKESLLETRILKHPKLGKITDTELARIIGCSKWAITSLRRKNGIDSIQTLQEQILSFSHFFGKIPDHKLAEGIHCTTAQVKAVRQAHAEANPPPAPKPKKEPGSVGKGVRVGPGPEGWDQSKRLSPGAQAPGFSDAARLDHPEDWYIKRLSEQPRELQVQAARLIWWNYSNHYTLPKLKELMDLYCHPCADPDWTPSTLIPLLRSLGLPESIIQSAGVEEI